MRVRDICGINLKNITNAINFTTYKYLDTGNITQNRIEVVKEYESKDELPSRAKRMVSTGDIIISTVRPIQRHYGILENPDENLLVSTGFTVLTPDKELVNPNYLFYYLTQDKVTNFFQLIAESSVSSYPSITPDIIGNLGIKLPPIEKQNEIVDIIKEIENKVVSNRNYNEHLKEYVQILFHKWFVDFNFPNKEGLPYNDNGGTFKEVNGKLIPTGFESIALKKITKKNTTSVNPSHTPDTLIKYYSIPVFDEIGTYSIENSDVIKSNKYKLSNNNLLVSKLNPWFKRVVYPHDVEYAICSTEFVVWESKKENHLEYLYVIANSNKFTKYCTIASTGTSNSHKRVDPDFMMRYPLIYNEEVVIKFNEIVSPMVKQIHSLIGENQLLKETYELLIKKLI